MAIHLVTYLHFIKLHKGPITSSQLRDKLELNPKLTSCSTAFNGARGCGYLKKAKSPKGASPGSAYCELTPKGLKFLEDNKNDVQSLEVMREESYKKRGQDNTPVVPMNAKADQALESIAKLLDDYNRANQMLRMVYQQIGDYLRDNETKKETTE